MSLLAPLLYSGGVGGGSSAQANPRRSPLSTGGKKNNSTFLEPALVALAREDGRVSCGKRPAMARIELDDEGGRRIDVDRRARVGLAAAAQTDVSAHRFATPQPRPTQHLDTLRFHRAEPGVELRQQVARYACAVDWQGAFQLERRGRGAEVRLRRS